MTKVKIKRKGGSIIEVECDGHTGYGAEGEDIVCAALSSIVQTALLGILQVAGVQAGYERDETKGYLKITVPEAISPSKRHDADVILNTMMIGIGDLYEGFSDFIEMEVD